MGLTAYINSGLGAQGLEGQELEAYSLHKLGFRGSGLRA